MKKFIKGMPDWQDDLNDNFDEVGTQLSEKANTNLLINEDFLICQRSNTGNFSIPSTDTVTINKIVFDRWSLGRQTTDYTVSAVKTDDGIYITPDAVKRMILGYALDMDLVKRLRNKNLTFSFDIKKDSSWTVGMLQVKAYIGENASEVRYDPTNRTIYYKDVQYTDIGTEYTRVTFTFPIKAAATNVSILFDTSNIDGSGVTINANAKIYLRNIKLELGSIATPFVPRLYAEELALCQRYYEQVFFSTRLVTDMSQVTTGIEINVPLKARKRVPPTQTITRYTCESGTANINIYNDHTQDLFCAFLAQNVNTSLGKGCRITYEGISDAEIY